MTNRNLYPLTCLVQQDDAAIFVLSVSKIDVEALDLELLLYYIFKVSGPPLTLS